MRFVDGSEQRYRDSAGTRLEWEIQLSLLDEGELAAIEEFFLAESGSVRHFLIHRSLGRAESTTTAAWRTDDLSACTVAEMRGAHEADRGAEHLITCWSYPQLGSGALSQFPVQKTGGPDRGQSGGRWQHDQAGRPGGEVTEWLLTYRELSDEEAAALRAFFRRRGRHAERVHIPGSGGQPSGVERPARQCSLAEDPLLSLTSGVGDPRGRTRRGD